MGGFNRSRSKHSSLQHTDRRQPDDIAFGLCAAWLFAVVADGGSRRYGAYVSVAAGARNLCNRFDPISWDSGLARDDNQFPADAAVLPPGAGLERHAPRHCLSLSVLYDQFCLPTFAAQRRPVERPSSRRQSELAMTESAQLRSGKGSRDENFPVASWLIRKRHRPVILAFYEFVRTADDIADHPTLGGAEKLARLDRLEKSLLGQGGEGVGQTLHAALNEYELSARHAQDLLNAFRQDVTKLRYANWDDLIDYCSRSAMPVGRFVLDVHGESRDTWPASDALCAVLQIINHLQDCAKDYRALDRVYIPLDAMSVSGVSVEMLKENRASPALRDCLRGLVARTSVLLDESRGLEAKVGDTRLALEISIIQSLATQLLAILTVRDPLVDRVHLNKAEALAAAANGGGRAILRRLLRTMAPAQRFQTP